MARIRASDTLVADQGRWPGATISAFLNLLMLWRRRLRCRRELSTFTAQQMHDAGLDPEVVRRESWNRSGSLKEDWAPESSRQPHRDNQGECNHHGDSCFPASGRLHGGTFQR